MDVVGKNIVVTGGASGIGAAFVSALKTAGSNVWALDRNFAEDSVEALPASSQGIVRVSCDVGDESAVVDAVARIDREAEGIDVLVNNAAILRDQVLVGKLGKRIRKHDTGDWDDTLRTNLSGVFYMTREVAATMIARKRAGLIVNMTSISRKGNAGQSAYAATKAAVEALTVTWSQEMAPYGIRVAAIAPGFVETGMTKNIPPLFLRRMREMTPLKRYGTLDEFGHAILFVIENDYFHGKTLELDGGIRF